jgi:hypothetical protein
MTLLACTTQFSGALAFDAGPPSRMSASVVGYAEIGIGVVTVGTIVRTARHLPVVMQRGGASDCHHG